MEYSVSELARIVGKSRQYIQKELRGLPRKKRPGRGGEYSYSINDLPIDIQKTVLLKEEQNHFHIQQKDLLEETSKEKRYSTSSSNASSLANHVPVFDDPESEARAGQRMKAWIEIFRLQDDWCYENKITKVVERDVRFADIYNREELIIPLWIRTVIPSLSRSNLAKIRGEYEKKGRNGLRGNYGNRKGATKLTSEMQEVIVHYILFRPPQIHEQLGYHFGKENVPSVKTVERFSKKWIKRNPQAYAVRQGDIIFNNNYLSAFGDASAYANHRGKVWQMDATKSNVVVEVELSDGKRYCILAVIDVNSRIFRAFVAESVSAESYVIGLRRMFCELGIPFELWVDQGLAEKSHYIQLICKELDIDFHLCNGESPWEKPHIERLHGIISIQLLELMGSFCGRNVTEKQQILSRQDGLIHIDLKPQELQNELDAFAHKKAREPHGEGTKGLGGRTPLEVWQDPIQPPIRIVEDERLLDLALAPVPSTSGRGPGIRTIGKEGIWVGKHDYAAEDGKCGEMIGRTVFCKHDPYDDAGKIWVFGNETREFLFIAYNPELSGKSRSEMARKRRQVQTQYKRAIQETKKLLQAKYGEPILPSEHYENFGMPPTHSETHTTHALESYKAAIDALKTKPSEPTPLTALELEMERQLETKQKQPSPVTVRDDDYFCKLCSQLMAGEDISHDDAEWVRRFISLGRGRALVAFEGLNVEKLLIRLDQVQT